MWKTKNLISSMEIADRWARRGKIMRVKIRAQKVPDGYTMIALTTPVEYPQEGRVHKTKKSVYIDARAMYNNATWDWRESDRSIRTD